MATHLRFQIHPQPGILPFLETRSDAPKAAQPGTAKRFDAPSTTNYWRPPQRPLRRIMTREHGRALEMIGHAVDYLNDSYIQEGPDEELIHLAGNSTEAVHLLVSARRQILHSLPLAEPLPSRLWNAVLRRKPHSEASAMLPLSSSR